MEIIQIVGFGLIATILILILKEQKPIFAFMLATITGLMIFLFLIGKIAEVISLLERLATEGGINLIYLKTILKIIGIAYIAEFGAQITRDAGQGLLPQRLN